MGMAKRLADAAANVEKGKKAKAKADDASFKHDPEEKAKPVEGEEKKEKKEEEEEEGEKKDTPKEKKAEKQKESLQQVKKTLAQVKEDGDKKEEKKEPVAAPEKVHVIEPTVYQDKANTNSPNLRTTFYDKK